jgi:hypothetical protein
LDECTCPPLLPKNEARDQRATTPAASAEGIYEDPVGEYSSLKECYQALQSILITVEAEHNRLNAEFEKNYIPATNLDGTPAIELPGMGFFKKAVSHSQSDLHTVCRDCWQMIDTYERESTSCVFPNPMFKT